jgi:hypothetical protein
MSEQMRWRNEKILNNFNFQEDYSRGNQTPARFIRRAQWRRVKARQGAGARLYGSAVRVMRFLLED